MGVGCMGGGGAENPKGNTEASQRSVMGESHCILQARGTEGERGTIESQSLGSPSESRAAEEPQRKATPPGDVIQARSVGGRNTLTSFLLLASNHPTVPQIAHPYSEILEQESSGNVISCEPDEGGQKTGLKSNKQVLGTSNNPMKQVG